MEEKYKKEAQVHMKKEAEAKLAGRAAEAATEVPDFWSNA